MNPSEAIEFARSERTTGGQSTQLALLALADEVQRLERENAALRADKERLDWLTDALDWVELGKCVPTDYDEEGRSRLDAWRMAIDAARREAQP